MSHVNWPYTVILIEQDFNNQVDRMTCSLKFSQPSSSIIPIIFFFPQWAHNKVVTVAVVEIMHGLSKVDFHSLKLI